MILNKANIAAALVGHRVLFIRGMEGSPPAVLENYASRTDSTGESESYHFTGGIPGMRAWVGKRVIHNLSGKGLTLVNEDYELTIGIPRNAYEDDKLGLWNSDVEMFGRRTAQHPATLLVALISAGFVTSGPGGACYDGAAMFSAAHPRSGRGLADQSNTGTAVLAAASFQAGITALRSLTDDAGTPLNLIDEGTEIHLVVPPALEAAGKALVEAEFNASGGTNTDYNRAKLVVLNQLTSATAWFLVITKLPVKPFIHQVRREAALVVQNSPTDDNVFSDKEVIMGVDGRYAVGYGVWQLMYASNGTV